MSFVFDRDFDRELEIERGEDVADAPRHTAEEMRARLAETREAAYREGYDKGSADATAAARDTDARHRVETLQKLAVAVEDLARGAAGHRARLEGEVIGLAAAVFEAVTPHAIAAFARPRLRDEIEAHLHLALGSATLKITLSEADRAALEPELTAMAERLDLDSKLAVTADPALASGDCRIAWDEGFLDYGYDAVCKQIVTLIRAAPGAAPAPKLEGQASHD